MDIITNLIYEIGNFGPFILFFISLFLLSKKQNLLSYYVVGIFINTIINLILKVTLQQPRPSEDPKIFNLALKKGKYFFLNNNVPLDIFGMPSGHAQSCIFSTTFIVLTTKKYISFIIYTLLSLITIYQRVKYNYHTIFQVIVGSVVGFLLGYLFYYFSQEKLKGLIREKKDDDFVD
jgi:membrane-associated phospholipid phosphatase